MANFFTQLLEKWAEQNRNIEHDELFPDSTSEENDSDSSNSEGDD